MPTTASAFGRLEALLGLPNDMEGAFLRRPQVRVRYGIKEMRVALPAAALVALSSVNWAYTWLRPDASTDELADRFTALLLDGMRGYSS